MYKTINLNWSHPTCYAETNHPTHPLKFKWFLHNKLGVAKLNYRQSGCLDTGGVKLHKI